jgi:hypothetical protein
MVGNKDEEKMELFVNYSFSSICLSVGHILEFNLLINNRIGPN